jgi:hypothetical protein
MILNDPKSVGCGGCSASNHKAVDRLGRTNLSPLRGIIALYFG